MKETTSAQMLHTLVEPMCREGPDYAAEQDAVVESSRRV